MLEALHLRVDKDKICVSKRRMKSNYPCIYTTTGRPHEKTWTKQRLTTVTKNNMDNTRINRKMMIRKQKWDEK